MYCTQLMTANLYFYTLVMYVIVRDKNLVQLLFGESAKKSFCRTNLCEFLQQAKVFGNISLSNLPNLVSTMFTLFTLFYGSIVYIIIKKSSCTYITVKVALQCCIKNNVTEAILLLCCWVEYSVTLYRLTFISSSSALKHTILLRKAGGFLATSETASSS